MGMAGDERVVHMTQESLPSFKFEVTLRAVHVCDG